MTAGLIIFIAVLVIDLIGLLIDKALEWEGYPTITRIVQDRWWVGALILLLQVVGFFGLMFHFYPRG